MKNSYRGIFVVLIAGAMISAQCMDSEFKCRQATDSDVTAIVQLMNEYAYKDDDKIVVVPEIFREGYILRAIQSGRLVVACDGETIVGYKKLFCITRESERHDILNDELRIAEAHCAGSALVAMKDQSLQDCSPQKVTKLLSQPTTYIYTGADFTHPEYRNQGINSSLTSYALETMESTILEDIAKNQSANLALVYGLTKANAGNNIMDGRTQAIFQQFVLFVKKITSTLKNVSPSQATVSRYHAFKPSFDPKSSECKPLSDDQSIPGYGCLIACALDQNA